MANTSLQDEKGVSGESNVLFGGGYNQKKNPPGPVTQNLFGASTLAALTPSRAPSDGTCWETILETPLLSRKG